MVLEKLMDIIFYVLQTLTSGVEVPDMPDHVNVVINTMEQYTSAGIRILYNYLHVDYLLTLLYLVLAADIFLLLYNFVMWVLNKIPGVDID